MNIQQNLNALLTMGAVGVRTSDKYIENAQWRRLSKQGQKLEQFGESGLNLDLSGEQQLKLAQEHSEIKEAQAKLRPSEKTVKEYKKADDWTNFIKQSIESEYHDYNPADKKAEVEEKVYQGQAASIETTRGQRLGVEDRLAILRNARKTYGGK